MKGMDAQTGRWLDGTAHLQQSIRDILTTPLGSRLMRPDYGSALFELIDAPSNPDTLSKIYAATVAALARWEPRLRVTKVEANVSSPGRITLNLSGIYLPDGQHLHLSGLSV